MRDRDAARTKERILTVARDLFAKHGYAGTSIADIAGRLGTSKAALYYHFPSKEEILEALVAGPIATFAALADRAVTERPSTVDLLDSFIDLLVGSREILGICAGDPSVISLLEERMRRHNFDEKLGAIVEALAGPHATVLDRIRGQAAMAVVKECTFAAITGNGGSLDEAHRKEILAAALRALGRP
jgi:AcrR family transcriptional regulator